MRAVAIMSYDRPKYLVETLISLRRSMDFGGNDLDVFLFQDNSYNPKSQKQKTYDSLIDGSVAAFRSFFPQGHVMISPINLGIALNYDRAERFLFEKEGYDAVMFFEDDMVLHKYYLSVLADMLDQAEADDRIGMVCCYGLRHQMPVEEQIVQRDGLFLLSHTWGYGLTRSVYQRRAPIVDRYVELLRQIDYSEKDSLSHEIHSLQVELGFRPSVTSQDMMKTMATLSIGCVNLNTRAVLGRYIGAVGTHSTQAMFAEHGYDATVLYPSDAPLPRPKFAEADLDMLYSKLKASLS